MRQLPVLLALVLLPALRAAAADCPACEPANMCVKHEKSDEEAMAEFTKKKSKLASDPMGRKAALEKLAKAGEEHLNCRGAKFAEVFVPYLEDKDSGIRQFTLDCMKTTLNRDVAVAALAKLLTRLVGKLNKPRPGAKNGEAAVEWDNSMAFAKDILSALGAIGGPEVVPSLIEGISSNNTMLAVKAAETAAMIRDKRLADAYIDALNKISPPKDDEKKYLFGTLANGFRGLTGLTDEPGEDYVGWLKKARAHWRAAEPDWK